MKNNSNNNNSNKKIPIVINLVKLPKNQYAIAADSDADKGAANTAAAAGATTAAQQAVSAATGTSSAAQGNTQTANQQSQANAALQNSLSNSASNKKQMPKQPSSQNNSHLAQPRALNFPVDQAPNGNTPNAISQASLSSLHQAATSSNSALNPSQQAQQSLQQKANPISAFNNQGGAQPVVRPNENAKDAFPSASGANPAQSQQNPLQSQTNLPDPVKIEKPQKKYQAVLPQCSHWFDLEKVHQIEKENLPEFFQGKPSKTPEIYKKYRNFIVTLYRSNPRIHLTATACRRNLAGDVCSILRLHAFLEEWGLINFNCDPTLTPSSILISRPTSSVVQNYKRFDMLDQERDLFKEGGEGDLVFNSVKVLSQNHRPLCDFCGVVCGLVWFQSRPNNQDQQMPNMVLCSKCFSEGNYPAILSEKDFDKTDLINRLSNSEAIRNPARKPWTHEETLSMLEKIPKNKDNWDDFVKNLIPSTGRTREEIVLHFLRLPLNNVSQVRIFDSEDETAALSDRYPNDSPIEDEPTIFSDYSNPLLQHIAIFKTLLDKSKQRKQTIKAVKKPVVAAAAAATEMKAEEVEENQQGKSESSAQIKEGTTSSIVVEESGSVTTSKEQSGEEKVKVDAMEIEGEKSEQVKVEQGVTSTSAVVTGGQTRASKAPEQRLGLIEDISESNAEDLLAIEEETKRSAKLLQEHQEQKIKKLVQSLIFCQLQKLENKLNYLEEYEKLIWYERNQMDITQSYHIAETVSLAFRRNELSKEFARQMAEHQKRVQSAAANPQLLQQQQQQMQQQQQSHNLQQHPIHQQQDQSQQQLQQQQQFQQQSHLPQMHPQSQPQQSYGQQQHGHLQQQSFPGQQIPQNPAALTSAPPVQQPHQQFYPQTGNVVHQNNVEPNSQQVVNAVPVVTPYENQSEFVQTQQPEQIQAQQFGDYQHIQNQSVPAASGAVATAADANQKPEEQVPAQFQQQNYEQFQQPQQQQQQFEQQHQENAL